MGYRGDMTHFKGNMAKKFILGCGIFFWIKRMSRMHKGERTFGLRGISNDVHTFVHVCIYSYKKEKRKTQCNVVNNLRAGFELTIEL